MNGVERVYEAAAAYVATDDTQAELDTFDAEIDAALASLSPAGVRSLVRGLAFDLALWQLGVPASHIGDLSDVSV